MDSDIIGVDTVRQNKMNDDKRDAIGEICTRIINNPEEQIHEVESLLNMKEHRELIMLSLAKVFKNIAPLYRIRLHSNKIKHKNQDLSVSQFDRLLFKYYNLYVKEVCSSDKPESFIAAAELLRSLDHFNFSDRLVAKVLLGTTKFPKIAGVCVEVLVDRIQNDPSGETIFMIIDQCLDYRFSHLIVKALLESKYLEKCVEIRITKEEYYEKESIERRKKEKKEKTGKGFFKRNFLIDKKERKEEKKRLQLQSKVREEEKQELNPINEKNYIRTVNALQRLYFTIFKNHHRDCFESSFLGIRKYIRIIRKEFHEGLYTLMVDCIKISNEDVSAVTEGVLTIYEIYKENGYDFKRILDVLYQIVSPLNVIAVGEIEGLCKAIRNMFLNVKQPKLRAIVFLQRLLQYRITRFVPLFDQLIKDIEVKYDIEFDDFEMKTVKTAETQSNDIDKVILRPFYEYYLFKKMR